MLECAILSLLMQVRAADPVRAAEAAEARLKANAGLRAVDPGVEARRQRFEEGFNALLKAMEAFSRKYNESAGRVWPEQEAAVLRRALRNLQKFPGIGTGKGEAR